MNRLDPTEILLTPEEFDDFVADQVNWMNRRLKDKPVSLMPHLVIKTLDLTNGETGITLCAIAADFNEDAEKSAVLMSIGRNIYKEKIFPLAIGLNCEAWLAKDPPEGIEPRHCDNRREVAVIAAQATGKNKLVKLISIPIRRDEQNRMESMDETLPDGKYKTIGLPILGHFYRGFFEAVLSCKPE